MELDEISTVLDKMTAKFTVRSVTYSMLDNEIRDSFYKFLPRNYAKVRDETIVQDAIIHLFASSIFHFLFLWELRNIRV